MKYRLFQILGTHKSGKNSFNLQELFIKFNTLPSLRLKVKRFVIFLPTYPTNGANYYQMKCKWNSQCIFKNYKLALNIHYSLIKDFAKVFRIETTTYLKLFPLAKNKHHLIHVAQHIIRLYLGLISKLPDL